MPTYGPSGTCGTPPQSCYTSGDISAYEAAIASKEAEKDDLQAQIDVINNDLSLLNHEHHQAVTNACPA